MFFYEMEHLIAFGHEEVMRPLREVFCHQVVANWLPWVANHMEHTESHGEHTFIGSVRFAEKTS